MPLLHRLILLALLLGSAACSRDPGRRLTEGLTELENGNPSGALKEFQSAADRLGGHPDEALVWNAVGVAAFGTGKEEEAEAAFLQSLDLDPRLYSAHLNLGLLYRSQGKMEASFSAFSQASQSDVSRSEALEIQAVHAVRLGDQEAALTYLRQAVGRRESSRTLSSLAVLSADELNLQERRDLLQQAVSMNPQFAPAQLNLAALLDQHRLDPEQAQAHYEAFIRLDPDSPLVPQAVQRAQVMEARVLSGTLNLPDPVRVEVEDILKRASEEEEELLALRLCLQAHAVAARASRVDLRERALRAATTLAPTSARAQVGLARFLREQGRGEESLAAFLSAHELAPQWPPAFSGAVILSMDEANTDQARELLSESEQAVQDQPDALLIVADLYASPLGAGRKARELYRFIRSEFPGSAAAETAEARLAE
jgi:tetratricopeptide (TPR) repeat protein